MQKRLYIIILLALASTIWARDMNFSWGDNSVTVPVPDDLVQIVIENKSLIEQQLQIHGITQDMFNEAMETLKVEYEAKALELGNKIAMPYNIALNALDNFSEALCDSIPNTQTAQNVWAESWIGTLIPGIKFGAGVNAGAATLDVKCLKEAGNALGISAVDDLPDTLGFPTATADIRIGGIILPFDIGFTFCTIDSTDFDKLDEKIDPCEFDYYSIGGDIRFKLVNIGTKLFHARASLGFGGYYTDGSVKVADDHSESEAGMDFTSTTLFCSMQASVKALCFMPFFGGRIALSKTKVDWNAHADWKGILNANSISSPLIDEVISWGILPTDFDNDYETAWQVRPQVYFGMGIDIFVLDVTASISYDVSKDVFAGAASVRISL